MYVLYLATALVFFLRSRPAAKPQPPKAPNTVESARLSS